MSKMILWAFVIIGMALLLFRFRKKTLIKDSILVFLLKAYFSTFIGIFVAKEKLIEYPVGF